MLPHPPHRWPSLRARMGPLLLTGLVACAAGPGLQRPIPPTAGLAASDAPQDPDGARRFGLFIGINRYPNLPARDQLRGCVNDMVSLHELLRDRFGFRRTRLLVDEQATRAGIRQAFQELLDAVEEEQSRAPALPLTVVLAYAGHGSRVEDQGDVGRDEADEDGQDESWVAHDSSPTGDRDVRDDEIHALIQRLSALGARVLLVSDSCHSGTVHRSLDGARPRTPSLAEGGDAQRPGPAEALLPALAQEPVLERAAAIPGFLSLTACRDEEIAYESEDAEGYPGGRFSLALREALLGLAPTATGREVHARVLERFREQYRDSAQTPQLHGSPGMEQQPLLGDRGTSPLDQLWSQERSGEALQVTARVQRDTAAGPRTLDWQDLARADGLPRLDVGDELTVEVTNAGDTPLHLLVLARDRPDAPRAETWVLVPWETDPAPCLAPGGTFALPTLVAEAAAARERTALKLLAMDRPPDLAAATAGSGDAVRQLLRACQATAFLEFLVLRNDGGR